MDTEKKEYGSLTFLKKVKEYLKKNWGYFTIIFLLIIGWSILIKKLPLSIATPFSLTTSISIALLSVIIPFFIFAVTLLGNTIDRKKDEETRIKEQERNEFDAQISDLQNRINAAKESGKSDDLEIKLKEIQDKKKKFTSQVKKNQKKYSLLKFRESVLFPGGLFLLAILINEAAKIYSGYNILSFLLWIISLLAIFSGVYRMCKCLILIEEVVILSEELQTKRLSQSWISALTTIEKEKQEELNLQFKDITFPYVCEKNTDLIINFRVKIAKGKIAKKAHVWFYIPDGFELISPPENDTKNVWRQKNDHKPPLIRTVNIDLGDVSIGPAVPRYLKIKTPSTEGEYIIVYTLYAEGYSSDKQQVKIIVK